MRVIAIADPEYPTYKTKPGAARTRKPSCVIGFHEHYRKEPVLQGDGALGAYEAGVAPALRDSECQRHWVAGISSGPAKNKAVKLGPAARSFVGKIGDGCAERRRSNDGWQERDGSALT